MTSKKAASKSSIPSDSYTGPVTRSHSNGIIQEQNQATWGQIPDVMFVIMADVTAEAAITEMKRKINLLMKVVEE
ncbi:ty3-gypsy retrotransposon protein [Cucumis melo var. makuwa]|uniref:Ty3-gypsy retrotransposon protein n=1 Tax=Cucumis melo var. makuwa TaxID=1194695 RepID=A0A5D3DZK2_CUCMM|nr:ty3-gypsy retrotransposon protein [Cucumis melo var. makuwa]